MYEIRKNLVRTVVQKVYDLRRKQHKIQIAHIDIYVHDAPAVFIQHKGAMVLFLFMNGINILDPL